MTIQPTEIQPSKIQYTEIHRIAQNSGQISSQETTSLKSRLEALLAPLHLLDQRLQQAIEIRQILLGTAFESYLLGSMAPGRSPVTGIAQTSPLAQLQASFGLSDFEIEVVLMAIAPELDRRYERLYAQLQPDACRRPTQHLSLDVLCHSTAEKEIASNAFSKTAPLIRFGLIHRKANGSFSLNPAISRHLLGQPMSPQLTAYCKLSWPQETGYVTNSPLLPDLLNRIREGSVSKPLALNFAGKGTKEAGAKAIAAAKQQPLLTVNLSKFSEGNALSNTEMAHQVQQVLLQGRLWNAVLYLSGVKEEPSDDLAAFQNRWFPPAFLRSTQRQNNKQSNRHSNWQSTVVQAFLDQLASYPETVIFSGQPLSAPTANSCKGLITIPFMAPCTEIADIASGFNDSWRNTQKTAPHSLSETEWFRQKVTGTVLGLS